MAGITDILPRRDIPRPAWLDEPLNNTPQLLPWSQNPLNTNAVPAEPQEPALPDNIPPDIAEFLRRAGWTWEDYLAAGGARPSPNPFQVPEGDALVPRYTPPNLAEHTQPGTAAMPGPSIIDILGPGINNFDREPGISPPTTAGRTETPAASTPEAGGSFFGRAERGVTGQNPWNRVAAEAGARSGQNVPTATDPPTLGQTAEEYLQAYLATRGKQDKEVPNPEMEDSLQNLIPSRGDQLMRFGFGLAAGDSPFFAQNFGNAGLAALDQKQEGYRAYQQALESMQQINETRRANRSAEGLAEMGSVADLYGRMVTANAAAQGASPMGEASIDMMKTLFENEIKDILATEGISEIDMDPAERERIQNEAIARVLRKYPGMAELLPNFDKIDVTDPAA